MVERLYGRLSQESLNNQNFMSLHHQAIKSRHGEASVTRRVVKVRKPAKNKKGFALKNKSKPNLQNNKEPDILTSEW